MATRRLLMGTLGGLAAVGAAGGMYAFWIEPAYRLGVAEYRIAPPNWPPGRTLTIAVLSDLHAGEPHMPAERLAEIVEATNALRPDLVLLLGDLPADPRVTTRALPVAETVQALTGLRAVHGVHAVLGEYDWWDDVQVQRFRRGLPRIARTLAEARISVLHNSAVKSGFRGQQFWVAGVGSLWAFDDGGGNYRGANDITRTLAAVTDRDPVILMCHEPDIFPQVPRDRVAITLAGHTHGGQVRLFGWSPVVRSAHGGRYAHGHVVEDGKHLVVSGGLGLEGVPMRLGVPPEITLIRLGAA